MGVTTHQVLQPGTGVRLPADVREALIEMGGACNDAAVHLHRALSDSMSSEARMEVLRARNGAGQLAWQVAEDLQYLADQRFEQAIVVLARAATVYAVYASQVAVAVAEEIAPPPPGSEAIRPSDLIAAYGLYLPEVAFPQTAEIRDVHDQNTTVSRAHKALTDLITHVMHGESAAAYDEIVTVTTTKDPHRTVGFAAALHEYATLLVAAISFFSGTDPDDAA